MSLTRAEGYLELGLAQEAEEELENLDGESRISEDVWVLRCKIYQVTEQWDAMRDVAKHLVSLAPQEVEYWLWAVMATRKAEVFTTEPNLDEGVVMFMGAAKWPDEIKFGHSPWNHKEWHYVDLPLTPPDFALQSSPAPNNDIIFAIDRCVKMLKDPTVSGSDKSNWMAWLIHLVGDITQPLHCCALVNEDFKAPLGDRGGNSFFVRAGSGKGVPLHKLWDDSTGTSQGFHAKQRRGYVNQSIQLGSEFKRASLMELGQNKTPAEWSIESWQIARDVVYLRGQLEYGKDTSSAVLLPPGYTKIIKTTSERRVAVAGYRLADLIREVVKGS